EVQSGRPRPMRERDPQVPEWLATIIAKLHAPNPADRFTSAAEVAGGVIVDPGGPAFVITPPAAAPVTLHGSAFLDSHADRRHCHRPRPVVLWPPPATRRRPPAAQPPALPRRQLRRGRCPDPWPLSGDPRPRCRRAGPNVLAGAAGAGCLARGGGPRLLVFRR